MIVFSITWVCALMWLMINWNFFEDLLSGDSHTWCSSTFIITIVLLVLYN